MISKKLNICHYSGIYASFTHKDYLGIWQRNYLQIRCVSKENYYWYYNNCEDYGEKYGLQDDSLTYECLEKKLKRYNLL